MVHSLSTDTYSTRKFGTWSLILGFLNMWSMPLFMLNLNLL